MVDSPNDWQQKKDFKKSASTKTWHKAYFHSIELWALHLTLNFKMTFKFLLYSCLCLDLKKKVKESNRLHIGYKLFIDLIKIQLIGAFSVMLSNTWTGLVTDYVVTLVYNCFIEWHNLNYWILPCLRSLLLFLKVLIQFSLSHVLVTEL